MNDNFRIIDANINRASEGLRVLEDIARFRFDNSEISAELKKKRHSIRESIMQYLSKCIEKRDSQKDTGLKISKELRNDVKTTLTELATANFKRVQEALRTLEEVLKIENMYNLSKVFEEIRFNTYSLEKKFHNKLLTISKKEKLDSDLYCFTSEEYSKGRDNITVAKEMISAGIKIIQYREKNKKAKDMLKECETIREMTKNKNVTFIVNDYIDIALSVSADGVHLGQDDLPLEKARKILGNEMIIGISTHSPEQAIKAFEGGADYIGVGPIFRTYTKKDVCEPVGLEYLQYVVENIKIPFVAIGGIKEDNILSVKEKGAKCIAMVTEIVGSDDMKEKIFSIRKKIR